jgi:hypothetical protein
MSFLLVGASNSRTISKPPIAPKYSKFNRKKSEISLENGD